MRILITVGIFPPDIGGPATYVPHMAAALSERGHQVVVVAPQEPGVPCPIVDPSYRLVRFRRARFLRYLNYFIELSRALAAVYREAAQCELIFVNGLGLPAALSSRIRRRPVVVKVVGDETWELAHTRGWTTLNLDAFQHTAEPRARLFRGVHHLAAKWADRVITPSRYLARIVQGWGVPDSSLRVVYNAFTAPQIDQISVPDLDLPAQFKQGFRLMTVGRLLPHKRISQIIQAVSMMAEAKLVVVGDGPLRSALEAQARELSLSERIYFTGRLPPEAVWYLLARYAEVFVLNSTYEGLPHVLLEAAHFKVPIVATNVGGTVEVVTNEETGLLIPPDSPETLLAALKRLQADCALGQRLASNAGRDIARFSPERMVLETEQVLREALDAASGS